MTYLLRAVGERVDFDAVPDQVRTWIERELGGRVASGATQLEAMSAGPAARIVLDDGFRYFVKAVGLALNTHHPRLFRREVAVLQHLPDVDYRPRWWRPRTTATWMTPDSSRPPGVSSGVRLRI